MPKNLFDGRDPTGPPKWLLPAMLLLVALSVLADILILDYYGYTRDGDCEDCIILTLDKTDGN